MAKQAMFKFSAEAGLSISNRSPTGTQCTGFLAAAASAGQGR